MSDVIIFSLYTVNPIIVTVMLVPAIFIFYKKTDKNKSSKRCYCNYRKFGAGNFDY